MCIYKRIKCRVAINEKSRTVRMIFRIAMKIDRENWTFAGGKTQIEVTS